MADASRFALTVLSLTHAGGTLNLTQLHSGGISPQSRIAVPVTSGTVHSQAHLLATADPMIEFATRDLATLLGAVPPTTCLAVTGGVLRYLQRDDGAGIFTTGAKQVTETMGTGIVCIESIGGSQDDETGMAANCKAYCYSSDGVANPITRAVDTTTVGMPTAAFVSEFYLGPVYINSVAIPGIKSWNVDFNVEIQSDRTSGAVFPTIGYIVRVRPMLRFTSNKLSADAAASLFNRAAAGTVAFYGFKAADNGIRTAAASTVHLKISAATAQWNVERVRGEGNEDAMAEYTIRPTLGSLAYSVASAIP